MKTIDCRQFEEILLAYIDDELDGEQKSNLEQHLADCEYCRRELARMKKSLAVFKNHVISQRVIGCDIVDSVILSLPQVVARDCNGTTLFGLVKWLAGYCSFLFISVLCVSVVVFLPFFKPLLKILWQLVYISILIVSGVPSLKMLLVVLLAGGLLVAIWELRVTSWNRRLT